MPTLYFNNVRYERSPLHFAHAPEWLIARMNVWGEAIIEAIVKQGGPSGVLARLSDPLWFQIFGSVLGMDWHSSGITTTVMGVLKQSINRRYGELGIYICGGKGKSSRQTPNELTAFADRTGLNGDNLIRCSRLSAKVDNAAIQDGFQIYMHSFIVTNQGAWTVVQQGMNENTGMARRYHWHSAFLKSFVDSRHTFVYGQNQGKILNLTNPDAEATRAGILDILNEDPQRIFPDIKKLNTNSNHEASTKEKNLIIDILARVQEIENLDFESLLLLEGVGPKTLYELARASHSIHGTSMQFTDPADFPFVYRPKGDPLFPIHLSEPEKTFRDIRDLIEKSVIAPGDKLKALENLTNIEHMLHHGFDLTAETVMKSVKTFKSKVEPGSTGESRQIGLFSNSL